MEIKHAQGYSSIHTDNCHFTRFHADNSFQVRIGMINNDVNALVSVDLDTSSIRHEHTSDESEFMFPVLFFGSKHHFIFETVLDYRIACEFFMVEPVESLTEKIVRSNFNTTCNMRCNREFEA
ncbi:hypothetical protein TW81_13470 [Vibrio galatheae]|uniref:Uncharacterized protein n=1 Tax=Vibrio galatheae TaxID=579748 RepID=A0A0F4NHV8_9VIBR|nr:hypothetical protein [Vibrio galatheae]KJY82418.1 hypothetical protein TW81_13470 [Vibrio galatheae]